MVRNEQGFTLLEVLLSITIFSIIIFSFMGFFSQGAIFNNKTEDKMTGVYFANEQMITLQKNLGQEFLNKVLSNDPAALSPSTYNTSSSGSNFTITQINVELDENNNSVYKIYSENMEAGLSSIIDIKLYEEGYSFPETNPVKKLPDLYFTHIEVFDLNGSKIHDLIGIITYKS